MGKRKTEPINTYDFSADWEEVQAVSWQWVMWDKPNEEVIGWIVDMREEEFTDKTTGEVRKNLVCYMATSDSKHVRFIVPTDLRNKLETINDRRIKAKREWRDIMMKIIYQGKVETSKGYKVKVFKVLVKKTEMPKQIADDIPELPSLEIEGLDEIVDNF